MIDRDRLIGKIIDCDPELARHEITRVLGPKMVSDEQEAMYDNGGGTLLVIDLCRLASNVQLQKVIKKLKIKE
jgi:hypothetical protein